MAAGILALLAALVLRWKTISVTLSGTGVDVAPVVISAKLHDLRHGDVGIWIAAVVLAIGIAGAFTELRSHKLKRLTPWAYAVVGVVLVAWTIHFWPHASTDQAQPIPSQQPGFNIGVGGSTSSGSAPYVFLLAALLTLGGAALRPVAGEVGRSRLQLSTRSRYLALSGVVATGAIIVLLAMADRGSINGGGSTVGGGSTPVTLSGSMSVADVGASFDNTPVGGSCDADFDIGGDTGYNVDGAPITVTNESGTIIASGTMPDEGTLDANGLTCDYQFTIPALPTSATFYTVTIGSHTGPTYSRSELMATNWTISESL